MHNRSLFLALIALALVFTQCGKDDDGGTPASEITVSTANFSTSIAENPTTGTVLGTVTGTTNSGSVNFSLATESVTGAMSINSGNGQLTVADETVFDFETNPSITGTVEVANGSVKKTANITITLTDVDETSGETTWSGATMTFTKADNTDPAMEANQDRITDKVWLTRGNASGDLYNAVTETASSSTSPAGTEWAEGTTADISNLTFGTLRNVDKPKDLVNRNLVLRLVEENIFIDLKITAWSTGGGGSNGGSGGGFSYERSTPN